MQWELMALGPSSLDIVSIYSATSSGRMRYALIVNPVQAHAALGFLGLRIQVVNTVGETCRNQGAQEHSLLKTVLRPFGKIGGEGGHLDARRRLRMRMMARTWVTNCGAGGLNRSRHAHGSRRGSLEEGVHGARGWELAREGACGSL
jgi:hypothetical protein